MRGKEWAALGGPSQGRKHWRPGTAEPKRVTNPSCNIVLEPFFARTQACLMPGPRNRHTLLQKGITSVNASFTNAIPATVGRRLFLSLQRFGSK
jgi:hypothetical protein